MKNTPLWRWLPAAAVLAAALPTASLSAQKLAIEKTHDVSGKAKRGFLDDVNINEPANKVDLVFCTKATNRKVKFETYTSTASSISRAWTRARSPWRR